jgi:DNA-binding CsgD family transcriptional regulator/PAS domain-containing protein
MVTVEDFSRLVSGLYAAAVTPQHWTSALTDISCILDATGSAIFNGEGTSRSVMAATVPRDARGSYIEYYHTIDHVLGAVEKAPAGLIHSGQALVALDRHSEFEADFLVPFEMEDGLFIRLTGAPTPTCFIVAAPRRSESFDTSDRVKLFGELVPHLQQALRTHQKLANLAETNVELAGALDVVRNGIIVVASDHRVINLNSAAERVLQAEDGLCMRSGRIAAVSTHMEQELHCAIKDALAGERSTVPSGRSLTCFRLSGKRPYVIHVQPSQRRGADQPLKEPMALVLIVDPEDEPEPSTALLRRLYHLTNAEADVALRMMHGADMKEISEHLSVSLPTVRTHLQHAFDKTDTHRQAELVRLLLFLCP